MYPFKSALRNPHMARTCMRLSLLGISLVGSPGLGFRVRVVKKVLAKKGMLGTHFLKGERNHEGNLPYDHAGGGYFEQLLCGR